MPTTIPQTIFVASGSLVPKNSLAAWKIQLWADDDYRLKITEEVAKNVRIDTSNNRSFYLLSHRCHLGTYPVSEDNEKLRTTLKRRSGGYEQREHWEIRKAFNLKHAWPPLPLIKLDAELQAHFLALERSALTSCHPLHICQQSMSIVSALSRMETQKAKIRMHELAQIVYTAGTCDLQNSRSVAVLVHQLSLDLEMIDSRLKTLFLDTLLKCTVAGCSKWWQDQPEALGKNQNIDIVFGVGNGLAPSMSQTVNHARTAMLNSAAFQGDLFAVGLVDMRCMRDLVWNFVKQPRSLMHLRALCLLFSRCVYVIGERFDQQFFFDCARELGARLADTNGFHDPWAQRWRIEICRLMELMLDQASQDQRTKSLARIEGQVMKQHWNSSLVPEKIFRHLTSFIASGNQDKF